MEETQNKIKKTIDKVRLGEINEWGPKYQVNNEADFVAKLKKFAMVDRDIQVLNLQIDTAVDRAMDGSDPELVIQLDDNQLNLDKYQ